MMLIIAISIAVPIAGIVFIYKNIVLPTHLHVLIREIQQEELPEFLEGEIGFAINEEIRIAFEVINRGQNNGQTILLINGHSYPQLTFPKYSYQPYIDAGYQLVKFDNRGVGASDWITDWDKSKPYSLEDMAADAVAVLNHLNVEKAHIIGFSMGGMIAQCLAINHPNHVLSLTSIMSTGFWGDPKLTTIPLKSYIIIASINARYGKRLPEYERKMKRFLAHNRYLRGKENYEMNDKDLLQRVLYEFKNRNGFNPKVHDQHTMAIVVSGSRYDKLKAIKAPTLIVHGTDDPLIKVEHAMKYAALIPDAKKLIVKGMGHDLPEKYMPEIHQEIFKNFKRSIVLVNPDS